MPDAATQPTDGTSFSDYAANVAEFARLNQPPSGAPRITLGDGGMPQSAPPENPLTAGTPDIGTAIRGNFDAAGKWSDAQHAQSARMGLVNPETGEMTPEGLRQFVMAGATGMVGTVGGVGAATAQRAGLDAMLQRYSRPSAAPAMQALRNDMSQRATGWWMGPDGKPRFEISDQGVEIRNPPPPGQSRPLADIIDHPELFKAYPQIAELPVVNAKPRDSLGSYYPRTGNEGGFIQQDVYRGDRQSLSTLLHETQHGIQDIEGLQPGANLVSVRGLPQWPDAVRQQHSYLTTPRTYEQWFNEQAAREYGPTWQTRAPWLTMANAHKYGFGREDYDIFRAQQALDPHNVDPLASLDSLSLRAREAAARDLYARMVGETEARTVEKRALQTPLINSNTGFSGAMDIAPRNQVMWPNR